MEQVVNQPPAQMVIIQPGQREWSTGLCDCCTDFKSCITGWFCLCCLSCSVARRLGENCCVPLFLQGGTMAMRTKLRMQYGIQGSICRDWCVTTFCGMLSICQMDRELTQMGIP